LCGDAEELFQMPRIRREVSLGKTTEISDTEQIPAIQQHWWMSLIELAVHVFVGTGMFLLICMPAVGLDLLLRWLPSLGVSNFILTGLTIAKLALFGVDLILFLVYMANAGWLFIKKLDWQSQL
jgi:hypothetical protein